MEQQIDIAVVGATGLVGNAVLEHLSESKISVGQIYALASDNSSGESVPFGNRQLTVHNTAEFDFNKVQLSFFCVPTEVSQTYIDKAVSTGNYCIDFSEYSRRDKDVPLVVQAVNGAVLEDLKGKVVASPDSSILHLAQILSVFSEAGVIERVNATLLRAVSEIGRKGIDELSAQSIALFNLKPIKREHFDEQIAFNVLPHACHASANHIGEKDGFVDQLQIELQKVMQDDALLLNASLVQVPVFYGHSMTLQLEFSDEVPINTLQDLISQSSELNLVKKGASRPNSVTDAVNQKGVYIGGLRPDPTWKSGINLWVTADNIHQGAAINGVQLAEILVKDYL